MYSIALFILVCVMFAVALTRVIIDQHDIDFRYRFPADIAMLVSISSVAFVALAWYLCHMIIH